MADEGILGKIGGFAADATVDTTADGFINTAVDDVASHIPGGAAVENVAKTGIDFEANSLINGELSKVEGMFGGASAPADPAPTQ
jgi:hypothetical protein